MVRRALTRTIKAIPPEPEVAAKYLAYWPQAELYHHPERFPRVTSAGLFGNAQPLEVEVGCGTGEFLCSLAAEESEHNFVGVDVWTKVIYRAVRNAAEQALDNIKFIRAPFEMTYPLLVPDSVRAVYVHYPDPNLRLREQHRIFNPAFLDAMHLTLEPGGRLHVVSDHTELFEEMLTLVEEDGRWHKTHAERSLVGYEPSVKSRYQQLWEKHKVPPLRFEVEKRQVKAKVEKNPHLKG